MPRDELADRRHQVVVMAWVDALDAACQAACRLRGRDPIDNTVALSPAEQQVAWEATAALSAGVAALAEASARSGIDWPEILEMALQDGDEAYRHRTVAAPRHG